METPSLFFNSSHSSQQHFVIYMMHGIVFAKQDTFSLLEKHTINSNVSVILKNTYSTFHVDNRKHSVAAFDEIFR